VTETEFFRGVAVLTAAGVPEFGEALQGLYLDRLRSLADGAFAAGVAAIVEGPLCADLVQYRRPPTLHELREAVASAGPKAPGRPYIGGVPLGELLDAAAGPGTGDVPEDEAAELVSTVARRLEPRRPKLLPSPGNTGHRALTRAVRPIPASGMTGDEWEERQRRLLDQADELHGAGEPDGEA